MWNLQEGKHNGVIKSRYRFSCTKRILKISWRRNKLVNGKFLNLECNTSNLCPQSWRNYSKGRHWITHWWKACLLLIPMKGLESNSLVSNKVKCGIFWPVWSQCIGLPRQMQTKWCLSTKTLLIMLPRQTVSFEITAKPRLVLMFSCTNVCHEVTNMQNYGLFWGSYYFWVMVKRPVSAAYHLISRLRQMICQAILSLLAV